MDIVPRVEVSISHESPLVCAGLTAMLHDQEDMVVKVRSPDCEETLPELARGDVIIADYTAGLRYLDTIANAPSSWRASMPKLLIVTAQTGEWDVRRAVALGVSGYLLLGCPAERIVHAVRSLARGGRCYDDVVSARIADSLLYATLTKREHDVLHLIHQGSGNKDIARSLDIQLGTVKAHVKAILEKLQVSSRTQAVVVAERRGLLSIDARRPSPTIAWRT